MRIIFNIDVPKLTKEGIDMVDSFIEVRTLFCSSMIE